MVVGSRIPVIFLLTKLGDLALRQLDTALAPFELRHRQAGVLHFLAHRDGVSQHELGERACVDASSMVALIDQLEGRGLVARRRDPDDRRRHAVSLTEQGRAVVGQLERARDGATDELLAPLDADERETLIALLHKLGRAHLPGSCENSSPTA